MYHNFICHKKNSIRCIRKKKKEKKVSFTLANKQLASAATFSLSSLLTGKSVASSNLLTVF